MMKQSVFRQRVNNEFELDLGPQPQSLASDWSMWSCDSEASFLLASLQQRTLSWIKLQSWDLSRQKLRTVEICLTSLQLWWKSLLLFFVLCSRESSRLLQNYIIFEILFLDNIKIISLTSSSLVILWKTVLCICLSLVWIKFLCRFFLISQQRKNT